MVVLPRDLRGLDVRNLSFVGCNKEVVFGLMLMKVMKLTQEFCDVVHAMKNLKEEQAMTTNTMVSSILLQERLLHCLVHKVHSNEVLGL